MSNDTEFSWEQDAPPGPRPPPTPKRAAAKKPSKRPVRPKPPKGAGVKAGSKLPAEALRGRVMFATVNGRKRVWACDGEYVFFRRKSCFGKDDNGNEIRNHAAIKRHDEFIRKGDYIYVETQDDVEICKVSPQSALYRKGQFLGEMNDAMLRRAIAVAACKRDWVLYVDALTEMSGRIKAKVAIDMQAMVYKDMLEYIEVLIAQRGGPTPAECGAGLQNVRVKRGEASGRQILVAHR